jgi:nitrogen regulatory protein PII 2
MLLLVLPEAKVPVAVETLIKANQTGKPGDGKIFVLPTADAFRIRTGEAGDVALNEEN